MGQSERALVLQFSHAARLASLQQAVWSVSKGFGTRRVGRVVGHRFLWVTAIVVDLEQDGEVHKDLQQATRPELHGSLCEQEVAGFKGVAAGPHQHHLDAGRKREKMKVKVRKDSISEQCVILI